MTYQKIPIRISRIKTSEGKEELVPTIPLGTAISLSDWQSLEDGLQRFGNRYKELINSCQEVLTAIDLEKRLLKKVNPLLFWLLGDRIVKFLENERQGEFYLDRRNQHFARELNMYIGSLEKILIFRRRYVIKEIDCNKGFNYYRNPKPKAHKK